MTPVRAPVDLRILPAIRAEAERQSSALLEAVRRHHGLMSDHTEGCVVEAHLDLLCDLTRPASRDVVARLVASAAGMDPTSGTTFKRIEIGGAPHPTWHLASATFAHVWVSAPADGWYGGWWIHFISGISEVTDPAEALRLIATHVLRSTDV